MTAFTPEFAAQVTAACRAKVVDLAQAFQRAFGKICEISVSELGLLRLNSPPTECTGSGLVFVFQVADGAVLAILPAATGFLPSWYLNPDLDGTSKLKELVTTLGTLLFSAEHAPSDSWATAVPDIHNALRMADTAPDASWLPLQIASEGHTGTLALVWPIHRPDAVNLDESILPAANQTQPFESTSNETHRVNTIPPPDASEPAPTFTPVSESTPKRPSLAPPKRQLPPYTDVEEGIQLLPPYSRSLLKIKVPVTVTLAEAKQPLKNILDIGPGSIIHFSKSCEDTLTMEVSGHKVAVGETVKVGDKFGLWITSMILPEERFWIIAGRASPVRAK